MTEIIEQAQEMLDDLMIKLESYKIPASYESIRFFEYILNGNGFGGVKINIDSAKTLMPVVTEAYEHIDLFAKVDALK